MRVLVTGGSGFIGTNLCEFLRGYRHDVTAVDSAVPISLSGYDAVVHLAAISGIPACQADPLSAHLVNVSNTVHLLQKCASTTRPPRVVLASSMAVLGGHSQMPLREDMLPKPISIYGATKAACEAYGQAYYHSIGLPVVSLRFANVYGPHSMHKDSLVAALCKAALRGQPLTINGDGSVTRDFIHVADICAGILAAIEAPKAPGAIIHLGGGQPYSVKDVAEHIAALACAEVVYGPAREGDAQHVWSDNTKAFALLDWWQPKIGLHDGLDSTYRWFEEVMCESSLLA